MMNINELEIGTHYWCVTKEMHHFRTKIKMTDADGVEWYRYEKPLVTYKLEEYVLYGKMVPTFAGEYPVAEENCENEFYVGIAGEEYKSINGESQFDDDDWHSFFEDRVDAEMRLEELQASPQPGE